MSDAPSLSETAPRPKDPPGLRHFAALPTLLSFKDDRITPVIEMHRRFGPIVMLQFAIRRLYLLNDPDAVHELLVSGHRHGVKDTGHQLFLRPILRGGLLLAEGDAHRKRRHMMQPAFYRERIAGYGDTMVRCANRSAEAWEDGQRIEAMTEMMDLALSIVNKTLFNSDVDDVKTQVSDAIEAIMETDSTLLHPLGLLLMQLPLPQVRGFRAAMRSLDRIVYRIIDEHRAKGGEGDLLDMLLEARDENDGSALTNAELRNEVLTLFLAGHETTANTMGWALRLIAEHEHVAEQFYEEVDRVLGSRAASMRDLGGLQYTRQIVDETLRMYPPAYLFGREITKTLTVAGYRVPRGSQVLVSPYVTHRDSRFFPDPERFDPDRFAPGHPYDRPRSPYFPFGAGPRKCIGERFAKMEAVLVLATLAQCWRFDTAGLPRSPIEARITLRPKGGIPLVVRSR